MKRSLSCLIAVAAGLCGLLTAGPAVATTAAVGDTDSRPAQARVASSPSGQDSLSASAYAVQQTGRLTVGSPRLADRLHRTDPTFSSTDRNEAIRRANAASAATADHLHLGSGEALVTRDVVRDTDGTDHIRYSRTYDGLPVIGGDLIVASGERGDPHRRPRTVTSHLASTRTTLAGKTATKRPRGRTSRSARRHPRRSFTPSTMRRCSPGRPRSPDRERRHADSRPRLHRRSKRQRARAAPAGHGRHRLRSLALQRQRRAEDHASGSRYQLSDGTRGGDDLRCQQLDQQLAARCSPTPTMSGVMGRLEPAECGGRCGVRRGRDVGHVQVGLQTHRHPQRRCRGDPRALRERLRERLLARLQVHDDLRRRRHRVELRHLA